MTTWQGWLMGLLGWAALACGGGGEAGNSGGSTDSLSMQGDVSERFVEAASNAAAWGKDPEVFVQEETSIQGIEVGVWSEWTESGPADGFEKFFFLNFKASVEVGDFSMADNGLSILYQEPGGLYVGNAFIDGADGSGTLVSVGEVGEQVTGSYEVVLCKSANGSDFPTNCDEGSLALNGSFDITREERGSAGRGKE